MKKLLSLLHPGIHMMQAVALGKWGRTAIVLPQEGRKEKAAAKGQESQHVGMLAETRVPAEQRCCLSPQPPWRGQAGAAPVSAGAVLSAFSAVGRQAGAVAT